MFVYVSSHFVLKHNGVNAVTIWAGENNMKNSMLIGVGLKYVNTSSLRLTFEITSVRSLFGIF